MNRKKRTKKCALLSFLRDYIVPPSCPSCGELLKIPRLVPLCADCREEWEQEKRGRCKDCGLTFYDCICLPPFLKEYGIRDGIFLSAYRSGRATVTDRLIYSVKRERDGAVFDFLAKELSKPVLDLLRAEEISAEDVYVVPLPRRRRAVRENGFDQAKLLAASLTAALGCEYRELLLRRRDGREQKALNKEGRILNLEKAFRLKGVPDLSGKTILLVDDVMTTGSGIRAAAELLKTCDAERIVPITVARTVASE